ncbi:MAG: hypothetical protein HYU64_17725 [Armatimonadetes bacterium]|nr:hypothetical protein [Armatimonadota bacterium]
MNIEGVAGKGRGRKHDHWTIFNFVLKEKGLGQDVFDGVDYRKDEHIRVVSAQISETGKVVRRFSKSSRKETSRKVPGEKSSFAEFLKWGIKKYPAQRYMIAFDGHSHKLRPLLPSIDQAVKEATGKVDIVKFGSCTMAHADIVSEFRDSADYLIANQSFSISEGYLENLRKWAQANPEKLDSPLEIGKRILKEDRQTTHSLVNLKGVPELNRAIRDFGEEILKLEGRDLREFRYIVGRSQRFCKHVNEDDPPLVDIHDLAVQLEGSWQLWKNHPDLVRSARKLPPLVREAIAAERHITGDGGEWEYINKASGLCLFVPLYASFITKPLPQDDDGENDAYLYNPSLAFWKETDWDKVIRHLTTY